MHSLVTLRRLRHHDLDVQVAAVTSKELDISTLLHDTPGADSHCDLDMEQEKDPELHQLRQYSNCHCDCLSFGFGH